MCVCVHVCVCMCVFKYGWLEYILCSHLIRQTQVFYTIDDSVLRPTVKFFKEDTSDGTYHNYVSSLISDKEPDHHWGMKLYPSIVATIRE